MSKIHVEKEIKTAPDAVVKEATPSEQKETKSQDIPAPGRPLSFEEALESTLKSYPNALRELAK